MHGGALVKISDEAHKRLRILSSILERTQKDITSELITKEFMRITDSDIVDEQIESLREIT